MAAHPPPEPLVSVVIPVYNRAHLIANALASVFAQSYENIEIVVVDDASTDDLAAALAQFADPRLRLVSHPRNRGAAAARNTGVAEARGEFVAFLDSDDVWRPGKLAHQVAAMQGQPSEVAGHVCAYECIKTGYPVRDIAPAWTAKTFRRRQFFGCTCGPGTTLLCRRAVFDDVGPLDEEFRRLEDWDWLLRLAAKGYRLIPSSAVLARVEVGSQPKPRDVEAAVRRIRERHHPAATELGAGTRRIFEASLLLESASSAFAEGAYARAICDVLGSMLKHPLRGGVFYRWLVVRALAALNRRRLA